MALPDRLNDPKYQSYLIEKGQELFNVDLLIKNPMVVFDYGALDELWTIVINSPKRDKLLKRVRSGSLVPINAEALSDISTVHAVFHVYIAESGMGIPTIPTIVNVLGTPSIVGSHVLPKEVPGVYVKKVSYKETGESLSHRAQGVSIVRITNESAASNLPKNKWEFLQPFIVPPDEYVRDIRTYLIGGEPVAGSIRRARKKLTQENLNGHILPDVEQYPSAQSPGPNEHLDGDLKRQVFSLARKIWQVLDVKMRSRARPFSPHSTFGFGSIDFLLDANGTPLPVDFDICPSVTTFEGIHDTVANRLAIFLERISKTEGLERKIMIIGRQEDQLVKSVVTHLGRIFPSERLIIQRPLIDRVNLNHR